MKRRKRADGESESSFGPVDLQGQRKRAPAAAAQRLISQAVLGAALLAGTQMSAQTLPRYRYHELPAGHYATGINKLGEIVAQHYEPGLIIVLDRRLEQPSMSGGGGVINARGDVAYADYDGGRAEVRRADGEIIVLEDPYLWHHHSPYVFPSAINEDGLVVGNVGYAEGASLGTVWNSTGSLLTNCLTPIWNMDPHWDPCRDTMAADISDGGIIVGASSYPDGMMATYWMQPDAPQGIVPGGAVAIGGERWIAGGTVDGAFVYDLDAGVLMALGAGQATDVNADGWVVGQSGGEAVLWLAEDPGTPHRLGDLLDWSVPNPPVLEFADRINDCGVIVGSTADVSWFLARTDTVDADGDDLLDHWEKCGVNTETDALVDLILKDADPMRKDIYVEIDAMSDQVPSPAVLQDLVDVFAKAPVANPEGPPGITLHFVGAGVPYETESGCDPCVDDTDIPPAPWGLECDTAFAAIRDGKFGSLVEREHPNRDEILYAKTATHRYGVFAHSYSFQDGDSVIVGSGGYSRMLSSSFAVTLGNWSTVSDDDKTSTLLHELGHTLGLHHGGTSSENYKPNYKSVMNYLWAVPPWRWTLVELPDIALQLYVDSWELDFSAGGLASLDEAHLGDGVQGIGGSVGSYVPIGVPTLPPLAGGSNALVRMGGPVDWDPNVTGGIVASNVNFLTFPEGGTWGDADSLAVLHDHDDWSALNYLAWDSPNWWPSLKANLTGVTGPAAGSGPSEFLHCLTYDEVLAMSSLRFDCNANGTYDQEEIAAGLIADANGNGIPDPCESHIASVRNDEARGILGPVRIVSVNPNPFNPRTDIRFVAGAGQQVVVTVIDLLGRRVNRLFAGEATGSEQVVTWTANGLPSAVYFVQVESGGETATEKVMLVR